MTFTSASRVANGLNKVSDDRAAEKAALKSGNNVRVVLTEVDKKHAGLPMTSLEDLMKASS